MAQHRHTYRRAPHTNLSVFRILQYPDARIELIETVPITELLIREQFHITSTDCVNRKRAYFGGTPSELTKQWRIDHPEQHKRLQKEYYDRHKNTVVVCPICQGEFYKRSIAYHKRTVHKQPVPVSEEPLSDSSIPIDSPPVAI